MKYYVLMAIPLYGKARIPALSAVDLTVKVDQKPASFIRCVDSLFTVVVTIDGSCYRPVPGIDMVVV